jgi:hypothetical protein
MKEIEITASKGVMPNVCEHCKKVTEEVVVYLMVFPQLPELIEVPLKPVEYCQCQREDFAG